MTKDKLARLSELGVAIVYEAADQFEAILGA